MIRQEEFGLCQELQPIIVDSAQRHGWRPEVIAGIISRESRFGLILEADGTGDHGHGHGLMQIDDRFYGDWLAENDWQDPATNIEKGVQILTGKYNWLNDRGYFEGLSQEEAEQASIAAYNCGEGNERKAIASDDGEPGLQDDFDERTAGHDYSADVLARAEQFRDIFA